jgi:hypothetical protein
VRVGDVRLFFDVDGAALVVDGPSMRERPTLVLLSGGPGFDHTPLVRYEQFEGAGHHVHHDDPDRLFELLREFVAEPGQATAVPTRTHVAQPDRCSP